MGESFSSLFVQLCLNRQIPLRLHAIRSTYPLPDMTQSKKIVILSLVKRPLDWLSIAIIPRDRLLENNNISYKCTFYRLNYQRTCSYAGIKEILMHTRERNNT